MRRAVDLRAALVGGALTAERLMEDTLSRIGAVNPRVNALVSLRPEATALAEARAADAAGRMGPLHGLPIAIKDLTDAAGLPTSRGSPLFAGELAASDDIMVARLKAAGAIVIGKSNTPAFGLGSHTTNPVFGPTRNPYDQTRTAGGSSGGAAAALACGMLPIADGSDMMGSLRNPAGWCNVYGYRPTWGSVPDHPAGDMYFGQLSTKGPMARSVADLRLLLSVMAGPDARRPKAGGADVMGFVPVKGLRIGWLGDWGGALPMEAGILEASEAAMQTWRDLGCAVEIAAPPMPMADLWQSWTTLRSWLIACDMAPLYRDPKMRAQLNPQAIWEIERGLAMTAQQIHAASEIRSAWFRTAAAMFDTYDAVVLPSAQMWPFAVETDWPREIAGVAMDTYHRWMEVVVPASLIGLPALCVPAGFGAAGMPFGLQVIGRYGADSTVLSLSEVWDEATGWPEVRPPSL